MRKNPKVCIQIDEIKSATQWVSVIGQGHYEELPEPQYASERVHAKELLETRPHWWLHALAERQLKSGDGLIEPLFFRIRIDVITGLRAVDEADEPRRENDEESFQVGATDF
jgi:nitroimidazol reductase NimA-like FMN-containing flavoprotein (pyridoxamine 5'-phosphate oxidase superfamily)